MNKKIFILILIMLSGRINIVSASDDGAPMVDALLNPKNIISGLTNFFYKKCKNSVLNAEILNDLPFPIKVHLTKSENVLMVNFPGKDILKGKAPINPYSFLTMDNLPVCHVKLKLETKDGHEIFSRTDDVLEDDTERRFFHTFTLNKKSHGEFMGPGLYGGPYEKNGEFSGTFFNNTDQDIKFNFIKNTKEYNVTLEKNSFAILSSDPDIPESIRAKNRYFTFSNPNQTIKVPLNQKGIAQIYTIGEDEDAKKIPIPLTSRYEIYKENNNLKVGIQGYNIGNYNATGISVLENIDSIKKSSPLRNINPIECIIDYQKQETENGSNLEMIEAGSSTWVFYNTKDIKIQEKLTAGEKKSIFVIRPQTNENSVNLPKDSALERQGKANLYIMSLDTQDDNKAKKYLNNMQKEIEDLIFTGVEAPDDQISISPQKIIKSDPDTKVTGTLLLVDTFISYGGGETTRTYIVPAPIPVLNNLLSIILPSLDPQKINAQNLQDQILKKIPLWLKTIQEKTNLKTLENLDINKLEANKQKIESVVPDLTNFIKSNGTKNIVDNGALTQTGLITLYQILFGPISLKNPPILKSAGANIYLYGK